MTYKNVLVSVCICTVSFTYEVQRLRMNCSSNKAVALILLWSLCVSVTLYSIGLIVHTLYEMEYTNYLTYVLLSALPPSAVIFGLPFSGWLADSRLGNFRVFRAGCVLLFLGSVLLCVYILIISHLSSIATAVTGSVAYLLSFSGGSACLVTLFQLGLDQMPDASSSGITSFILSLFIVGYLGVWIADCLFYVLEYCTSYLILQLQGSALLPVLCMSISLTSLFLFGEKWLIVEPNSPQSLKNIYRVLKFAIKHKAPLNRSALTYWEKDIPSRLDLGKSRYGGPFTTEQVEDVKSFFRLFLLLLILWISVLSNCTFGTFSLDYFVLYEHHYKSSQICLDSVYMPFTYDMWWCALVSLFIYSVFVYPCFMYKFPSILKRLGFYLFLLLFLNIVYSFVSYYFYYSIWPHIAHNWLCVSLLSLVITSSVEFVCAQSPYNMRGLLSGLNLFIIFTSTSLGSLIYAFLISNFSKHHLVILYSTGCALSATGFLLFLVVACRYKRRVRDEEYIPQTHIEAIYDRYLTQAQEHQRVYDTSQFVAFNCLCLVSCAQAFILTNLLFSTYSAFLFCSTFGFSACPFRLPLTYFGHTQFEITKIKHCD